MKKLDIYPSIEIQPNGYFNLQREQANKIDLSDKYPQIVSYIMYYYVMMSKYDTCFVINLSKISKLFNIDKSVIKKVFVSIKEAGFINIFKSGNSLCIQVVNNDTLTDTGTTLVRHSLDTSQGVLNIDEPIGSEPTDTGTTLVRHSLDTLEKIEKHVTIKDSIEIAEVSLPAINITNKTNINKNLSVPQTISSGDESFKEILGIEKEDIFNLETKTTIKPKRKKKTINTAIKGLYIWEEEYSKAKGIKYVVANKGRDLAGIKKLLIGITKINDEPQTKEELLNDFRKFVKKTFKIEDDFYNKNMNPGFIASRINEIWQMLTKPKNKTKVGNNTTSKKNEEYKATSSWE